MNLPAGQEMKLVVQTMLAATRTYHVYNENSALSQVVMNPCNHKILAVSHAVKDALKQ